jgi:hypothetical protein
MSKDPVAKETKEKGAGPKEYLPPEEYLDSVSLTARDGRAYLPLEAFSRAMRHALMAKEQKPTLALLHRFTPTNAKTIFAHT